MAETMIFHYRNDDNILTRMNPNAKLVGLLSYSAVISSAERYDVFALAVMPVIAAMMIHLPWRRYLRESSFFIVLAAIMWLSAYCHSSDFISSAASAVAFLAMVLASVLLTDTTMPDELSRSLGSALSHVLGKYAYALSSLMEITLSMIPLIIDSAAGMLEARKARGTSFISHPLSSLAELSSSILSDIFDKAEIYIDALYSRGYDTSSGRYCAEYRGYDWLIIASCIVITIAWFIFREV